MFQLSNTVKLIVGLLILQTLYAASVSAAARFPDGSWTKNELIEVDLSDVFVSEKIAVRTKKQLKSKMYAIIKTNHGTIKAELFYQQAPMTVANFVGLAEGKIANDAKPAGTPFYDGQIFHRTIPEFMIQGGDPNGNGMGGPGYSFPDEFHPELRHDGPGILSMANSGPATNGSQFFITHKPTPHLDDRHAVFGKVVEGQDVVVAIGDVKGDPNNKPFEDVVIESVTIERVGKDAQKFDAAAVFEDMRSNFQARKEEKRVALENEFIENLKKKFGDNIKETASGLMYIMEEEGEGATPAAGSTVSVHYDGLFIDGKKFDSSYDRGQPLDFPVGQGRVIAGWDEGIMLLKKGGKATMIIPSKLGYGDAGYPPIIPPKATLVFKVELVDFR